MWGGVCALPDGNLDDGVNTMRGGSEETPIGGCERRRGETTMVETRTLGTEGYTTGCFVDGGQGGGEGGKMGGGEKGTRGVEKGEKTGEGGCEETCFAGGVWRGSKGG